MRITKQIAKNMPENNQTTYRGLINTKGASYGPNHVKQSHCILRRCKMLMLWSLYIQSVGQSYNIDVCHESGGSVVHCDSVRKRLQMAVPDREQARDLALCLRR